MVSWKRVMRKMILGEGRMNFEWYHGGKGGCEWVDIVIIKT